MRNTEFTSDNLKSSSTVMFVVVLILAFWFYTKYESDGDSVLNLEITKNAEIIFDGTATSMDDFPSAINKSISKLKKQGVDKEKIVVAFYPDRNLRMGIITDANEQLRQAGLKKITYTN